MVKEESGLSGLCQARKVINLDSVRGYNTTMDDRMNIKTSGLKCDRTGWNTVRLGDTCIIKARIGWQGLKKSEYLSSGNYSLVSGTDFDNGFINWDSCSYVTEWRYNQDKNIQLRNGDVLITKDGTIGKVAFVQDMPSPTTLNSGVFVIRPKDKTLHPSFLQLIFKSRFFTDFLDKITAGSTIVHLYQKDIVDFEFPLPKSIEQLRIAQSIANIDQNLIVINRLLAKYESIKKATVNLLLKPKDDWKLIKLGDIGNVAMCKRILKSQTSVFGEVPFYKIGTFGKNPDAFISRVLFEDYKQRFSYPQVGDVLLSAAGTIGRTVVFNGEDAYFQDSNIVWIVNDERIVSNKYLNVIYSQLEWQTENGGTVSRLYNANIPNTTITIPHLEEQKRIVASLESVDSAIIMLKEQLNKSQNLKQSMLQYFFSD